MNFTWRSDSAGLGGHHPIVRATARTCTYLIALAAVGTTAACEVAGGEEGLATQNQPVTGARQDFSNEDGPETPVWLKWEDLDFTGAAPVAHAVLAVGSAWTRDLVVEVRVACYGMLDEPPVLRLGQRRLAPGETATFHLPIARLPLQSTVEVLQLRGEAFYRQPSETTSEVATTGTLYYRHHPGYAAATFSDSLEFMGSNNQRAASLAAASLDAVRGRIRSATGGWRTLRADDEAFALRDENGVVVGQILGTSVGSEPVADLEVQP